MPKATVYTIRNMPEPSSFDDWQQLLEDASKGSGEALSTLYNRSFDKIFRFIYYRVSHLETAEDLTEDVFIKAFRNLKAVEKHNSFEAWLYQIARNTVIDYYRSKKQNVALEEIEQTHSYEDSIIDTLQLEAEQKQLLTTLSLLPPEQQRVLRLKFFEELENVEIAAILNKTEGAVRVIQFRALAKLKTLLNPPIN